MKRNKNNNISRMLLSMLALVLIASSCSDWTDVESLDINQNGLPEQNPALYAKYLENLRAYKESDHKQAYVWFDNSEKAPSSRAHHITDLPDSIDVVNMVYPGDLADFELKDMEEIRSEKGTKIVYTVSYDAIKKQYDQMVIEETEKNENYVAPDFITYLKEHTQTELAYANTYNYDGIIVGYKGLSTVYMTAAEKAAYQNAQEAFLQEITTWQSANSGKMMSFEGSPQFLLNKTILQSSKHIILNTLSSKSAGALSIQAMQALVEGVPTDRFMVAASIRSLDGSDTSTGYYDGNLRATTEAAYWVTSQENGFTKAGLAIYNVQGDYYNPANNYQYVKEAINIMNPAPKN